MTPTTKPVTRVSVGSYRDGGKNQPIVIELGPGDLITFRLKGSRTRFPISVEGAMRQAQKIAADAQRREKAAKREARKRSR